VAGLFSGKGDATSALAAIAGGVAVAAGLELARGGGFFHGLTPPMWGIAVAAAAYMMAAALVPRRADVSSRGNRG
jgi:hypothetical protein